MAHMLRRARCSLRSRCARRGVAINAASSPSRAGGKVMLVWSTLCTIKSLKSSMEATSSDMVMEVGGRIGSQRNI